MLPTDNQGRPLLDSIPRDGSDNIKITVHWLEIATGRRWSEDSALGHVALETAMVGDDFTEEQHWIFNPYWWTAGNMGCDCNRGQHECSSGSPNKVIIERITPAGMPDVVLLAEEPGSSLMERFDHIGVKYGA